ncbi:MAG: dihydrofolate reductase family protein [Candidatus Micrarchaeia archaeon]
MKVTMYAAATPNGMIAGAGDDLGFITQTEWQGIMKKAYDVGNCIMGRRAYEVLLKRGKFPYNCLNIVMTKKKQANKWPGKVIFTGKSPRQVLKMLEQKGFQEALVLGGGTLNASFAKQKLIDEIILDVEPGIFTKGTRLFNGKDFSLKLKLIDARQVSPDEARIVYKVER